MKVPLVYEKNLRFYGIEDVVEEIYKWFIQTISPTILCRMLVIQFNLVIVVGIVTTIFVDTQNVRFGEDSDGIGKYGFEVTYKV